MLGRVLLLVITVSSCHGLLSGAENTNVIDYPYHVSLQYNNEHICSAALFHERWLLTAASCVHQHEVDDLNIRVDSSLSSSGGTELAIGEIIIYDDFDQYSYDNDIALIQLVFPTEYRATLLPVLIPSEYYTIADGTETNVTGWIKIPQGGSESQLTVITVPIVNQDICNSTMPVYKPLSASMICAGYMQSDVETCQGDSGAPLVVNDTLIGIFTYGLGCLNPTYPDVYTRVTSYVPWITNKTGLLL